MKHLGDITKISGYDVLPVDVVIGGSPCQDLSVAGKQAGLAGARSGLFMEQIRIIKEMRDADVRRGRTGQFIRPRFMVWEQVPGVFSSNKGDDFRAVLEEIIRVAEPEAPDVPLPRKGKWPMADCWMGDGWSIAYRVLDAQFWGVPQRRRRIALVADFGGHAAPEISFVRQSVCGDSAEGGPAREKVAARTGDSAYPTVARSLVARYDGSPCIDRGPNIVVAGFKPHMGGKARGIGYEPTIDTGKANAVYDARGNEDRKVEPLPFDTTQITSPQNGNNPHYGDPCHPLAAGAHPPAIVMATGQGGAEIMQDISPTLNCNHEQPILIPKIGHTLKAKANLQFREDSETYIVQGLVRRLTPLECERLQGYPDGWTVLREIGSMTDSEYEFWKSVLFEKEKREGRVRLSEAGVWEIWKYIKVKDEKDGGHWENTYKPYKPKEKSKMIKWYNKSFCKDSDSARYKALGNSIALPPWSWVLKRLCACYERTATMASLFDGIGGFPLIWERLNGPGSCLWASEIEEFPIAVTKRRFGGIMDDTD